mgnify:CR=1 FL=1
MIRLAWMGWRRIPWREGLLGCWIRARTPATGSARTRSCSRSQGWKIRFPSDRIIRIFAHQNSIKILSEFSKIITIFQKFWQIFRTSQHFLELLGEIPKKIIKIYAKFDENCRKIMIFAEIWAKMRKKFDEFLQRFWVWSGATVWQILEISQNAKNEYLVANIGFDTEKNEPSKVW